VLVADMRKLACANAADVTSTKTPHATSTEATHMASAKAAHAPATVSSATASAAAGLCTSGKKAAGKQRACQNHHHSSSHDILRWDGRTFRRSRYQTLASQEGKRQRRDRPKLGMLICRLH
jgi:hypothetical protein